MVCIMNHSYSLQKQGLLPNGRQDKAMTHQYYEESINQEYTASKMLIFRFIVFLKVLLIDSCCYLIIARIFNISLQSDYITP